MGSTRHDSSLLMYTGLLLRASAALIGLNVGIVQSFRTPEDALADVGARRSTLRTPDKRR
jgi:hypothetical protein